ncbi:hypothetical protein C8J57DRAFT_1717935 [Mycena rebaudengoi]|nr:hypothetical protein C8J57DRAFT_1717935 [Mycena rebaudengoi]
MAPSTKALALPPPDFGGSELWAAVLIILVAITALLALIYFVFELVLRCWRWWKTPNIIVESCRNPPRLCWKFQQQSPSIYRIRASKQTQSMHPKTLSKPSVRHVSLPPVKLHDEDWDTDAYSSSSASDQVAADAVEGQIKRMHDKDSKLSPSIANRDSAISNGGRRLSGMILDLPSMIVAPNTDSVYRAAISDYRYRTAVSRWTAHAMASNINLECPNLSPGFCSCCPTSTQHDVSIRKSLGNDAQM